MGFAWSGPVNDFRGAFVRWFGRTACADTRQPAFLRASCDHACARHASTRNSPATEQSGRIDAWPIAVRTPTGPDGRDFADTAPRTMARLQPLERKSLK